ncbi:hypothetical protein [Winogradskyella sediminis]|uniref:Uncharacterized protein n=1 Tax=Winogradskyella sediminis TaxID=1382466 RepID=A0A1H1X8G9_9FLAO|nr:hypothetical protein [Winogradskyella sediminis]SDT05604.1 hypothetical protein SAMN04489797_3134 [Winogradskyella sediminis]
MNIEKTILLLVFYLITSLSFGQTESEKRVSELINKLSWDSVTIDCNYDLVLTQTDSISNELVEIGKPFTTELINALKTPEKTIALHIILTRIFEDTENRIAGIGTKYIYKNCKESVGWHHLYNGITWEWTSENGQRIPEKQIDLAYNYWNRKLILKEKVKTTSNEEIYARLTKEDNIKYPCIDNRNYENNSAIIKIQELQSLLGKSNKSKDVNELMNRLGNDSIHSYFKDSYFVNYDTDGISFKFKKDSTLYCVFLEQEYKGTFWHGIKMDYEKKKIKKIIKPTKREKFGGKMENFWYTEPKFQIQFYSDDRIKYIMINN